ncbi:MAG: efflux RND transporter periplasmic adaptor subunit [Candidatus Moranbacteria bacterium]|nr:efflux RND transporter periplasmic adaptor subunit [Candidatus Moranbacteria bacterium]
MNDNIEKIEEKKPKGKSTKSAAVVGGALLGVIVVVGAFYLFITDKQIYTDKADIEAPAITIASNQGGTLQKMLVENGQKISSDTPVAQVADQILRSDKAGLVIDAQSLEGKTVNPGEPVVTLINPDDLRVVAHVDEDKGLGGIKVGQLVNFTVDASGSKKYTGIVDEISATSRQSGVVFNISNQREVKQFDVKIKFDVAKYGELKNGMSAKVTIFTK